MTDRQVLITGGAGYIGSHTVLACRDAGYPVVVLDNLSKGQRRLVPEDVPFFQGDVGDPKLLAEIISRHDIAAVIHFAADVVVPESVAAPLSYYLNNTCKTRSLLQACVDHGVAQIVFSSTAAVYGQPEATTVGEDAPTRPANPYGTSKLMSEWMLRDASVAHGLRHVILRYFNVAGADPQGRTGQATPDATHLIKVACEAACGKRGAIEIYGDDYDTADGTCVRDFIHVSDLARAHVSALEHLGKGGDSLTLNCGYGRGYSVREVLEGLERLTGKPLPARQAARRAGDVAALVADASRLREVLGWVPQHDDLDFILKTALQWELATAAAR
ncbi:UDP-glucose 4-epimerase GalE [Pelagibius sp. 7325]|uniref:UDP-glucose 4-epimerase GalE n=1 Tax=Pelagibius sp. 7325 TaxID=3131994 RepID=UPI0030EB261D